MVLHRFFLIVLAILVTACDQHSGGMQGGMGAPEVGVKTLKAQTVTLTSDLTGRITGSMKSDVRPQVDGIIKKRLFTEGEEVKEGQVLYQIDPASYQASYDEATAQLKNAIATLKSSKLKAERYVALVKENGVSRQDADDALATYQQNVASVAQYQAAVESARIKLDYTKVKAPISGRIGISSVTPGALVTASQSDALATIRALDPIYVDLTQSSTQLLKLRKQQSLTQQNGEMLPVSVRLEDGSVYTHIGRLELTEVSVDESTGSVTLRAIFPNPEHELLPGMYIRATVNNGVMDNAILAPQQGITRDVKGNATALIINGENKVELRNVTTDRVIGNSWLVTQGLQSGDKLIVEGTDKVQPGTLVKAVEVDAKTNSAAIASGTGGK
ncbi:efflux RND transporter periplasmic adaptor subunit [Acerihabitans arboris]|uniref:Efflux RND transporter periplasmic adaptor subunit n=1 Tax=Acerihabitans arboris TaxID=2691583 RepID=A0A845STL9_9GAMM|nr:efflux RND transporter periplasmic adaptor subunit [Acerihabitans arboris]NDL65821.1 efflux RND transporter periplasmic adaptor subunit [Acerihabitans arboris]